MWTLIREGGVVPMLFLLLLGGAGILAGFHFAVRAERRTFGFLKAISAAILFATLAATCADVGATLHTVSGIYERGQPYTFRGQSVVPEQLIVDGLAESTSPGILGFSFLALTFMLMAVGRRRLDELSAGAAPECPRS
jgi:hypothetical protein